ncbi:lytic transglycosylase domain-containing protein [Xanthomonas campestris pv. paulliniae]|nr:lytic transglycosylase domain-containing protein [Xanthomonas euvesicatoria]MBV6847549.1 lytic transglycosylase domain-containing protein [Xanthomonas campestris pv. paulliniae]MDH4908526.1 lytic transglycosylase domain-containing protein [Xanthomonas euvesicatoria]
MELMGCAGLAVPGEVMQHVVRVESSRNPYAIGVVGGRLVREPKGLEEAVATAKMLEQKGYNFSLGLGQVNRYNLLKYGITSYEMAFAKCPNLVAASRILAECHSRSGADWGKSFSCYYSGNFETGFKHGYVQKIYASIRQSVAAAGGAEPISVIPNRPIKIKVENPVRRAAADLTDALISRRIQDLNQRPLHDDQRSDANVRMTASDQGQAQPSSPPATPNDLYVIQSTGQGHGVAVPASAAQPRLSNSALQPAPTEASTLSQKGQVDNAFVF